MEANGKSYSTIKKELKDVPGLVQRDNKEFKKKEYRYLAFSSDREQVVIQYKKK